ncbi:MAG TPA: acyltransferase [Phycisphaerales bacterium]|nr:acyltransferase [Phycisphaerales bacterium]
MDAAERGQLIGGPGVIAESAAISPDRFDPRFFALFSWFVRRLLRKSFFAVRLERESAGVLRALASAPGPAIVALSHPSWWDPLVCVHLSRVFLPRRAPLAPLDRDQWERFGFMKRIGLFGINPADRKALSPMIEHVLARCADNPGRVLWITPQGRFSDAREPVVIRPGVAAVAARLRGPTVVALAIEYAFWTDRRPEVFLRAAPVEPGISGDASTPGWHRAIQSAMRRNGEELASLVVARDAGAFECLLGGGRTRINPVYDLWQSMRGRDGPIHDPRRENAA